LLQKKIKKRKLIFLPYCLILNFGQGNVDMELGNLVIDEDVIIPYLTKVDLIVYATTCKKKFKTHYQLKFTKNIFPFFWGLRQCAHYQRMRNRDYAYSVPIKMIEFEASLPNNFITTRRKAYTGEIIDLHTGHSSWNFMDNKERERLLKLSDFQFKKRIHYLRCNLLSRKRKRE